MEKIKHLIVGIISFLMFASFANASKCEYTEQAEINQEAAGVKITYEEKQTKLEGDNGVNDFDEEEELYEYYFTVHITNITDNLYFKVINSVDNSTKIFSSSDAIDGVISFDVKDLTQVNNLTIKIYSSSKTNCVDEEVLVQTKTIPMYNIYSTMPYCEENPKDKKCQKYVTTEVTEEDFQKVVQSDNKKKVEEANESNEGAIKKATKFVKKNKIGFIIGGSIIIVAGVVTTVVVINKRRSRLI